MDKKKTALLVGALALAMGTALIARNMLAGSDAPANAPTPLAIIAPANAPKVLVATRELPAGTIIGPDAFRFEAWPKDKIDNAYFVDGQNVQPESLAGQVVRLPIAGGQPIPKTSLVKPGDRGFLAAALTPGMRAMTVAVSAETGVAGFVFPGDRVDMVLTQTLGTDEDPFRASETIIRNLRVLATDQQAMPTDEQGKRTAKISETVTLEVTPRIAEKIFVAKTLGNLSLTLRSMAETPAELERAIAKGDVNLSAKAGTSSEQDVAIDMAARPSDANPSYATGADVSRFQRKSRTRAAPAARPAAAAAPPKPSLRIWRASVPEPVVF